MSFAAIRWAMAQRPTSSSAHHLLLILADCVNHERDYNSCYPSQEELAQRSIQSPRTVRRLLVTLEEEGFIHRSARLRSTDVFTLAMPPAEEAVQSGQKEQPVRPNPTAKAAKMATKPGTNQESNQEEPPPIVPPLGLRRDDLGDDFEAPAGNNHQALALGGGKVIALADHLSAPSFAEWWALYPKKVDKGGAEKAYDKALKILAKAGQVHPARYLHQVMSEYSSKCVNVPKDRRTFIPNAATWLNGKRWGDDLDAAMGVIYGSRTGTDWRTLEADVRLRSLHEAAMGGGTEEF